MPVMMHALSIRRWLVYGYCGERMRTVSESLLPERFLGVRVQGRLGASYRRGIDVGMLQRREGVGRVVWMGEKLDIKNILELFR